MRSLRIVTVFAATALTSSAALMGCSRGSARTQGPPALSQPPRMIGEGHARDATAMPRGGGSYKIGQPYQIGGRWYFPKDDPHYDREGLASWYGADFHGKKTANGEIYDMNALTAAHPTLPLPSYVTVTNLKNGRTLLLRVNDRGPYAHGRLLDLSRAAARLLGTEVEGIGTVRVRYVGRAPLDGNTNEERAFLARQAWAGGIAREAIDPASRWSLGGSSRQIR